ncbi:MAG: NUDIX hydrolase, partial [bacterium]|nr:NUDIX hydrolase [bacterium]
MKVTAIPADKKRGWAVSVNGEESDIKIFEISSRFGTLTYGLRPEGYDGWAFREAGGGGDVTLPFSFTPDGELLIGLLLESRANMGDQPVWCVIGGFIDAGETHEMAQAREAVEEAGIDARKAQILPGLPTN